MKEPVAIGALLPIELMQGKTTTLLNYEPNSGFAESTLTWHHSGKGYVAKDVFLEIFRKVANANCSTL